MKKLTYILMFFLPAFVSAQFNLYKDSPLDFVWQNVGNAGFSDGISYYVSLAFSPSGEPYVVYSDAANSFKATVMRFDGINWVYVGTAGFSNDYSDWTNIAFSPTGKPYVAFLDWSNSKKATVMNFNWRIRTY
jgi:hypothetical protein